MEFTLKKQEMIMVVTILLGAFIAALSQSLLTNAIPIIMSEINITASWAQWMTSAYGLTIGIVAITTPYLISKYDV